MAFLDEVMTEHQQTRADPAVAARNVARFLLTVLAGVLYAVGWTVRKTFVVGWLILTWSWTAVRLGWREAAPKPRT